MRERKLPNRPQTLYLGGVDDTPFEIVEANKLVNAVSYFHEGSL